MAFVEERFNGICDGCMMEHCLDVSGVWEIILITVLYKHPMLFTEISASNNPTFTATSAGDN